MSSTLPPSDFARLRRLHERGTYDRQTIEAILDAAPFCHIGHVIDGRPVVTPTLHWREGDHVYWHGSSASRMLRDNAKAHEVCLTASLFDGYVLARSAFHHSANFRSVMCFGTPRLVADPEEKIAALRGFMERLFPGRWDALRPVNGQELKATSVLALPLTEASAKVRAAPPSDDPDDIAWPIWAGVLPVRMVAGVPEPDAYVKDGQVPPATPVP